MRHTKKLHLFKNRSSRLRSSVCPLVAPDRSISAHQPFWRWQMPVLLSVCPSHRTGFFSIDHFLCVCKMGVNIKRKGRTRSNSENSTLSASLPHSSSNPLQLLSNKWTHRRVSAAVPSDLVLSFSKLNGRGYSLICGRKFHYKMPMDT